MPGGGFLALASTVLPEVRGIIIAFSWYLCAGARTKLSWVVTRVKRNRKFIPRGGRCADRSPARGMTFFSPSGTRARGCFTPWDSALAGAPRDAAAAQQLRRGASGLASGSHNPTVMRRVVSGLGPRLRRFHASTALRAADTPLPTLDAFKHFERRQTRWNDCDGFGHVNNAIYYQLMDDAVNMHLLAHGVGADRPRFVASSSMRYLRPFAFPSDVNVGLRVAQLGSSSAQYEIGLFPIAAGDEAGPLAAVGTFVHVYVDSDGRPTPIDETARGVLTTLTSS